MKKTLWLPIVGIVLSVLPISGQSPTWNQWRGPNRDGVWPGQLPEDLSKLQLVWEVPLQPSYSGPVTDGETVYTTETDYTTETVDETFERMTA